MENEAPLPGLAELLNRYYNGLHPYDKAPNGATQSEKASDELKSRIIDYLQKNPSIDSENILFIKQFTKVAKHILNSEPDSFDGLVERLYDYHLCGIMKIQEGIGEDYNDENAASMRVHLHGHAANIALLIFNSIFQREDIPFGKKMYWCEEVYNNEISAIGIGDDNPLYMCIRHDNAGEISKSAYGLLCKEKAPAEDKINWLKKCHFHKHAAAEISRDRDAVKSEKWYCQSSEAAMLIFKLLCDHENILSDDKPYWITASYEEKMKSAGLADNPVSAAYKYKDAAEVCSTLYGLTHDIFFLDESYRMHNLSAKMTINLLPSFSAWQEKSAGDVAANLLKLAANPRGAERWKKKAIRHYKKYIRLYTSTIGALRDTRSASRWKSNIKKVKDAMALLEGQTP